VGRPWPAAAIQRERLLLAHAADWYLAHLTLDERLGQMLLVGCSCGGGPGGPAFTSDFAYMVEQQHIGGVILFANNFGDFEQTRATLAAAQAHATIPFFVATDQEGGSVSRIDQYYGSFPSARTLGDSGDPRVAFAAAQQAAQDLRQLGINTDFAPVVDMPINGGGYWGPWRSFADDPAAVARFAGAYMQGLQQTGEIAVLKHFPGIGSISDDPHQTLPVVTRSLSQLRQAELYPYSLLLAQAPGMVMATDVLVPAVDGTYPAELSPIWINGILRQQLGYQGVVITDSLWMGGIANRWSLARASVLAVEAGCDIVIGAYDSTSAQATLDGLRAAVAAGQLSPILVALAVRRILLLKLEYGLLPIPAALAAEQQAVYP
jgi:beta-N-acetylhexosaminidase